MSQTAELAAELDAAPDTIEATLNYIVADGSKVFTTNFIVFPDPLGPR